MVEVTPDSEIAAAPTKVTVLAKLDADQFAADHTVIINIFNDKYDKARWLKPGLVDISGTMEQERAIVEDGIQQALFPRHEEDERVQKYTLAGEEVTQQALKILFTEVDLKLLKNEAEGKNSLVIIFSACHMEYEITTTELVMNTDDFDTRNFDIEDRIKGLTRGRSNNCVIGFMNGNRSPKLERPDSQRSSEPSISTGRKSSKKHFNYQLLFT